jgi:hypothetical protein
MVRDLTNKRITERAVRNYAVLPAEFLQTKLYKNIKNMKRFFLSENMKRFWREVEQTQDTQLHKAEKANRLTCPGNCKGS